MINEHWIKYHNSLSKSFGCLITPSLNSEQQLFVPEG